MYICRPEVQISVSVLSPWHCLSPAAHSTSYSTYSALYVALCFIIAFRQQTWWGRRFCEAPYIQRFLKYVFSVYECLKGYEGGSLWWCEAWVWLLSSILLLHACCHEKKLSNWKLGIFINRKKAPYKLLTAVFRSVIPLVVPDSAGESWICCPWPPCHCETCQPRRQGGLFGEAHVWCQASPLKWQRCWWELHWPVGWPTSIGGCGCSPCNLVPLLCPSHN